MGYFNSSKQKFRQACTLFLKRKNRRRYGDRRKAEDKKKEGQKGKQIKKKTFEEREGGESEHCTSTINKRFFVAD